MLSQLWPRTDIPEHRVDAHVEKIDKYEDVFWEHSEDDEINKRLNAIIAAIEAACRPVIDDGSRLGWVVRIIDRGASAVERAKQG